MKIDKVAAWRREASSSRRGGASVRRGYPIRKKGKLPHKRVSMPIRWNTASMSMEIAEDAVTKGEKVILVDDLIATGDRRRRGQAAQQQGADVLARLLRHRPAGIGGADKIRKLGVPVRR